MKPSDQIDQLIAGVNDLLRSEASWRGKILANLRNSLMMLIAGFQGASLPDPNKLFNAGLEGNRWRAIDLFEGDKINEHNANHR